jgi:multiple sugar transport system ATP-binding protein
LASIRLNGLTKKFGSVAAVSDIHLDVASGDFLVLLGPSGCGKSTLLRMLAGLETVSSGEIHLNDRRIDKAPPSERDMAFVFQSYALYPHMTVRQNITFPLLMKQFQWWFHLPIIGHMAKRRIERSPEVADLVEQTGKTLALTEMFDRYPRTLSGGQRQRVALGRAMVRRPEVFLMDEPLSNLDAKLRTSMRAEISRLHRRLAGTFVYVTHDQVEAMTMGTKIALMSGGRLQQYGTPRQIYDDPANVFVARFIGSPPMNLIEGTVSNGNVAVGKATLPMPPQVKAAQSARVLVGIRPNTIALHDKAVAGSIEGSVTLVEQLGTESSIAIVLDGASTAHSQDGTDEFLMVTQPGYSELAVGQKVHVTFDTAQMVLFDAGSGERVR